jgi:hypothetical protein
LGKKVEVVGKYNGGKMEIKINGQILDASLEEEKTAYEVADALIKQFDPQEVIVSSIEINNRFYSLEDSELQGIQVDSIDSMNIELATKEELIINLLAECKEILRNIAKDLRENSFSHSLELGELFQWIVETVQTINNTALFNMVEVKLIVSTVQQIQSYLNSENKEPEKIDSLAGIILSLSKYFDAIQTKIASNFSVSKKELSEAIQNGKEVLPEISEAFQTGRDKEALEKINVVISLLELCCIYLKKNMDCFSKEERDDIDSLYEDMNILLTQIVDAFENGDMVLLGDLLEYELPDKLEDYSKIVLEK